jgi:poly-beta-1,6-N-acetyl-D-glucosamine synthase
MTDILMARTSVITTLNANAPTARNTQPFLNRARSAGRALTGASALTAIAPGPSEERARHATIAAVIPCCNEQDTIEAVLKSLLAQTRMPDVIHIIVNNTDDDTIEIANRYLGHHRRAVKGVEFRTSVHVHDMGVNTDKKVGALNYGYRLSRGHDFILGVDGDTTLDRQAVEFLEMEMVDDPRIGGLSAIYTVDHDSADGPMAKFLLAGQRAQFAGFNMDNLLHGRNMAVLGGQCSLFSVLALEAVMRRYHQNTPWVRDSEVEDSLLSLQIKKVGFATKISSRARASVGGMPNLRALHSQQVKWNYGGIDLMWPGQRGNTKGQPLHPNLRLRWFENIAMIMNVMTRLAFLLLLAASLDLHAFVFNPIWLIPPAVAGLLNLRLTLAMHTKRPIDIAYAILLLPAEFYMWIRMGHFTAAWVQFFARVDKDNWAAQAHAEKGRGSSHLWPAIIAATLFAVLIYAWTTQPINIQSAILSLGWPVLYLITILQTLFMLKKITRRHRSFTV